MGWLVRILLEEIVQLLVHYSLAACARKNVLFSFLTLHFICACLIIFVLFFFSSFGILNALYILASVDHELCMQDMDAFPSDSNGSISFCGQKCREVSSSFAPLNSALE